MKFYKYTYFSKNYFSLKGFSLIEIMIVISIFALLGVLVTQSLALSIRGSKKSEASAIVRSNLASAASTMERQLRNANSIKECPVGNKKVIYENDLGVESYYECSNGNIYSGSNDITLIDTVSVDLTTCDIICNMADVYTLDSIQLVLVGEDKNTQGPESAEVSFETKVLLRNY